MSEIEPQGLLNRTNPLDNDPEAMDMITIDGVRISKFDIRALKVGKNVPRAKRGVEEVQLRIPRKGERLPHYERCAKDTHTV